MCVSVLHGTLSIRRSLIHVAFLKAVGDRGKQNKGMKAQNLSKNGKIPKNKVNWNYTLHVLDHL